MSDAVDTYGLRTRRFEEWVFHDDDPLEIVLPPTQRTARNLEVHADALLILLRHKRERQAVALAERLRSLRQEMEADVSGAENGTDDAVVFWKNWTARDFLGVVGIMLSMIGLVFSLFATTRQAGILFPIGAALMAVSGFAARRRDLATD